MSVYMYVYQAVNLYLYMEKKLFCLFVYPNLPVELMTRIARNYDHSSPVFGQSVER